MSSTRTPKQIYNDITVEKCEHTVINAIHMYDQLFVDKATNGYSYTPVDITKYILPECLNKMNYSSSFESKVLKHANIHNFRSWGLCVGDNPEGITTSLNNISVSWNT